MTEDALKLTTYEMTTAVPNVPVRSLAVRQFLTSMNIPLNMPVTLQFSDEVPND